MELSASGNNQSDINTLHQELINQLKNRGLLSTPSIEAAFRAVGRHHFLPNLPFDVIYRDQAIATKSLNGQLVSSSSQPAIMAIMLEQLQLQPGHRVLEIGAGAGYNAALMAHLVGETGQVVTIDIDEDLVEGTREHLAVAGFERVKVICGDGAFGYPDAAPYDRIILTVNAGDIAPAWRTQLKQDGRLVLPLTLRGPQVVVAFRPVEDHLESISARACGFVGLRGSLAESGSRVQLHPEPETLFLKLGEDRAINAETLSSWLASPGQDLPISTQMTLPEAFYGLNFWLATYDPRFCELIVSEVLAEQENIPKLFHFSGKIAIDRTFGLLGEHGLSLLTRDPTHASPLDGLSNTSPLNLFTRSFGSDPSLVQQLMEQIKAWEAAGRPSERELRIKAYSQGAAHSIQDKAATISKQWTQFILDWQ